MHGTSCVEGAPQAVSRCAAQVLRLLIRLYEGVESPDWVSIAQCLLFLDDTPEVAKILNRLLRGSEVRISLLPHHACMTCQRKRCTCWSAGS